MTPEELSQLKREVEEMKRWKQQKELQQLSFPLDDSSRNILRTFIKTGVAASETVTLNLTGNAQNIVVPATPDGYLTGTIDGAQVHIPYFNA
jgi:hypothetical protein